MKINYLASICIVSSLILLNSCQKQEDEITKKVITEITTNQTFKAGELYVIEGMVAIEGVTLTIEAGTTIEFNENSGLSVGYYQTATIIANGTKDKPIIFKSSLTGGKWDGIYFYSNTTSSTSIKYCNFSDGGNGTATINSDNCKFTFSSCQIINSVKMGITMSGESEFVACDSNIIQNCGTFPMSIPALAISTIGANDSLVTTGNYGIEINSSNLAENRVYNWNRQTLPYYFNFAMVIDNNEEVNINAGSIFKMGNEGKFEVGYYTNGKLTINGTAIKPVNFTSVQVDGNWLGISFYSNAVNSCSISYCNFENGGSADNYSTIYAGNIQIAINHCQITNSNKNGIYLDSGSKFASFSNNTISGCGEYPLVLYATAVHTIGTGNTFATEGNFGIKINANELLSNTAVTWTKQSLPYFVDGTITIDNNAELTIDAGTTLKFNTGGKIEVGYYSTGRLIAIGTVLNMITFTTSAMSPSNGSWDGIYFYSNTANSELNTCNITYGGANSDSGNITLYDNTNQVTVAYCLIGHSAHWGVYMNQPDLWTANSLYNSFIDNNDGDIYNGGNK